MRVLLFEDHDRLAESIVQGLAGYGFGIDAFETAEDGLNAYKIVDYDAIILDLGLPDRDGFDVLKHLRQKSLSVPILVLTARDHLDARVMGLDAGADDYVVKPIAISELAARLRALLRRPGYALGEVLVLGNLQLHATSRQVTVDETSIRFSAKEVEALEILLRRQGQVLAKKTIEDSLYGLSDSVTPNNIEVLISRLRRRLADCGANCSIHTFHGIGYMLKESKN
jgi:DNA-binding response OmpR family regulator